MDDTSKATVRVQGKSIARVKPSELILVGSIVGDGISLQISLDHLEKKRAKITPWLAGVGAASIDFGSPRLPNQLEPDAYQLATQHMRRRMHQSTPPDNRRILQTYAAVWPIRDKTSDEILVLSDRLKFEAIDKAGEQVPKEPDEREFDFMDPRAVQKKIMSEAALPASDNREPSLLFRAELSTEDLEVSVNDAFQNAKEVAEILATGMGRSIGKLCSVDGTTLDGYAFDQSTHFRETMHPMLKEIDLKKGRRTFISENPKPAEFAVSVNVTYELSD